MNDGYAPVLKMLGQRQETDSNAIVWIVVVMIALPLLLLLGNHIRLRLQRRRNKQRSFEQLEKLSGEKGLTYSEESLLERIAESAQMGNPVSLLTSVETFDRAIAIWMKHVMQMPWLTVDEHIEQIAAIRRKIGFRYLSAERPPISTRELREGQRIYSLAAAKKGLRLISAEIITLDDLAITTTPFTTPSGNTVKLTKNQYIWGFFWSEAGGEYRFRTHPLKENHHPSHHLLLQHGDELFKPNRQEIFSCAQNQEAVIEWVSAADQGLNLSPKIFERIETPETIAVSLQELNGGGCVLSRDSRIDIDDLVRFPQGGEVFPFLAECVGRVIDVDAEDMQVKFLNMQPDAHDALLRHIAQHLSIENFQRRLKAKSARQRETP